jgi:hypothetical protein
LRTYPLYDPKIYSIVIFRSKEGEDVKSLDMIKKEFQGSKGIKCDITFKDSWWIIELSLQVSTESKGTVEVSPDLIKVKITELMEHKKKLVEKLQPFIIDGGEINHYTLVTCGSNEKVWMKTFSDISFLYKDSKQNERLDLLQSNISYLNRILNRTGEIAVNSIQHGKLSSSIYIMGNPQGRLQSMFPRDMVIEMDMGDIRSITTYGESPIEVSPSTPYGEGDPKDKKEYQMRQNYLINLMAVKAKLVELFLIQSQYADMKDRDLHDLFTNGRSLKDKIFQLQYNINNHMQLYIPKDKEKSKKGKEKDFLDRESFETEKELLTRASVQFSLVSEVEHKIMRLSSSIQVITQKIDDISTSLNLKPETVSLEGLSQSISDETKRQIDASSRELSNLLNELSHSRDILSSTIEVLRTFIDTRQREVSEEMSRLMNVLFLVFACIGLADALGNFVILGIEYIYFDEGTTVGEVLQWSSFGLMLTLLPLLIAVIFLVLFFKKKR